MEAVVEANFGSIGPVLHIIHSILIFAALRQCSVESIVLTFRFPSAP